MKNIIKEYYLTLYINFAYSSTNVSSFNHDGVYAFAKIPDELNGCRKQIFLDNGNTSQ